MALTFGGGAGVLTIPGLSADGNTPPGINVTGTVTASGQVLPYPGVTADGGDGLALVGDVTAGDLHTAGLAMQQSHGQFVVKDTDGNQAALSASGLDIAMIDNSSQIVHVQMPNASVNEVIVVTTADFSKSVKLYADGRVIMSSGVGTWGHAAPATQPLLATGAAHTVDDVITLLQSYGLCKQS